jgi:hypothetical protein
LFQWQNYLQACACPGGVYHGNIPAMRPRVFSGDRQAQTGAPDMPLTGRFALKEGLENAFMFCDRDARPAVCNLNDCL